MELKSSAFEAGGMIPKPYTCDGQDASPPLSWSDVPNGAKSLALIADDPDAPMGTWVHWVAWNIPATVRVLEAHVPKQDSLPNGMKQGTSVVRAQGQKEMFVTRVHRMGGEPPRQLPVPPQST